MRVGIIGGGFAGLAAAIAFRRIGHDVTVFEKAPGPLTVGGAISLAPNALACLADLGVKHRLAIQPWSAMQATVRSADGRSWSGAPSPSSRAGANTRRCSAVS